MKIYVDQKHIERRSSIGKWASLLGLGVLGIGFFISLKYPTMVYVSFGSLVLGFLLSSVGTYYANRYAHRYRPDAMLASSLKGFDDRYALYQFLLPVSQVLREPGGITVFVLKPQEGRVLYQGGKWRHRQGWMRLLRWIGQEGIGKPEREVAYQVQAMQEWLEEQAPELEVPVRGVILFTHPEVDLALENPPVPALSASHIKNWLRKAGKRRALPKEIQAQMAEVLNQALPSQVLESIGE